MHFFLYIKKNMRDFTIFFFNFIHIKKHNNNNLIVKTKRLEHLAIIII